MKEFLTYDIEIRKAVPQRRQKPMPGVEYCDGWEDYENMGVAVIGSFDAKHSRYQVWFQDGFHKFQELAARRTVVGFNSKRFDDNVMAAAGFPVTTHYDVLVEIWEAAGLPPQHHRSTHGGFSLDAMAQANFGTAKDASGAWAPIWWQRGMLTPLVNHCLQDVGMTHQLLALARQGVEIRNPHGGALTLKAPRMRT